MKILVSVLLLLVTLSLQAQPQKKEFLGEEIYLTTPGVWAGIGIDEDNETTVTACMDGQIETRKDVVGRLVIQRGQDVGSFSYLNFGVEITSSIETLKKEALGRLFDDFTDERFKRVCGVKYAKALARGGELWISRQYLLGAVPNMKLVFELSADGIKQFNKTITALLSDVSSNGVGVHISPDIEGRFYKEWFNGLKTEPGDWFNSYAEALNASNVVAPYKKAYALPYPFPRNFN